MSRKTAAPIERDDMRDVLDSYRERYVEEGAVEVTLFICDAEGCKGVIDTAAAGDASARQA